MRGAHSKTTSKFERVNEYTANVPKQPARSSRKSIPHINHTNYQHHPMPLPTQDRRTPPAYPFLSDLPVKEQNQTTQRFIPLRKKHRRSSRQSQPRPKILRHPRQLRKRILRRASVRRYLGPGETRVNSMTVGFHIHLHSGMAAML